MEYDIDKLDDMSSPEYKEYIRKRHKGVEGPNKLSDRDLVFLDVMFSDEHFGDTVFAAKVAKFPKEQSSLKIARALRKEIVVRTEEWLAMNGPTGALGIMDVLNNPGQKGAANKLNAAKDILDRIGVTKKQTTEVVSDSPTAILVLPDKNKDME